MSLSKGQATNPTTTNTTKTFVTALVANGGLLVVEVAVFLVLKQRLQRIYSPRTFLPPPDKRAPRLPNSWWRWLPALIKQPSTDIIHKNGLDAYLFLRFLKMLFYIFLVFTIVTFLVIVPVDSVGISSSRPNIERITWVNLSLSDYPRFSAHIVVVYLLTFFVYYMIRHELAHFVHMRHQFLISKSHSRLAQARTVLITSVPEELANERDLRLFASFVPGGIDRVWIYRDTRVLNKLYKRREKACKKLEGAEAKILRHATLEWRVKEKKAKKDAETAEEEEKPVGGSVELLNELVPKSKRPTHRVGFLGMFGEKVDTIDWCKDEIAALNTQINDTRQHIPEGKFMGSVFIRCNLQMGAHVLAQCISYHQPLTMYDKWMETNPGDIVWDNLDDGALEMRSRYVLSWAAMIGLIIAWGFPVAFITSWSNLDGLCQTVSWLAWLCKTPNPIPGIIQGIVPPLLLAILFALLPLVLYALAWYECIPRKSLMSLSVYRRFYIFLLIHGFLIATISSTVTQTIQDLINNPTHAVQTLSTQLPGASIFFLTYMVTQGLAGAGAALVQLITLITYFVRKWFLGRTPRQAFSVTFMMPSADFGTILPMLSLLATITFAYSVLNPLINLLAFVCFGMLFLAWKFLLTQVFDQPEKSETGGLYFPLAVSNLFVGLYIEQICLACLFFLQAQSQGNRTASIVEGALMLVLVGITTGVQLFFQRCYDPITRFLPMSLATSKMAERYAKQRSMVSGIVEGEEMDLFSRAQIQSVRRQITKVIPKRLDETVGSIKRRIQAISPIKSSFETVVRRSEDAKNDTVHAERKEKESLETVVHKEGEPKGSLEVQHLETKELERVPSTSQHPALTPSTANSSESTKRVAHPIDPDDNEEDYEDEIDPNEHAFDHPSTYMEQPWIWIPRDSLGLSKVLVGELQELGVFASDDGAVMDEKGIVEVTRNPPDEEWVDR